jgi:hypothetical protein
VTDGVRVGRRVGVRVGARVREVVDAEGATVGAALGRAAVGETVGVGDVAGFWQTQALVLKGPKVDHVRMFFCTAVKIFPLVGSAAAQLANVEVQPTGQA